MSEAWRPRSPERNATPRTPESVRGADAVLHTMHQALAERMEVGAVYTATLRPDGMALSCTADADSFSSLLMHIKAVLAEENEKAQGAYHFVAVVRGMHEVDIQLAGA